MDWCVRLNVIERKYLYLGNQLFNYENNKFILRFIFSIIFLKYDFCTGYGSYEWDLCSGDRA